MELTKFKICPECGKHNPPGLIECRYCEADLTGVRVVDHEEESSPQQTEPGVSPKPSSPQSERALVRICECGEHNPPQARKCRVCGEDITDIMPTEVEAQACAVSSYELRSTDGAFATIVGESQIIIGRDAAFKDYLAEKVYVSRRHARLTIDGNKVLIENLSGTNKTFVNNAEISGEAPTILTDGDEIGLGGKVVGDSRQDKAAYFVFRVIT